MHKSPALIFDLDGTLVDTAPDLLGALNAVLVREVVSLIRMFVVRETQCGRANFLQQLKILLALVLGTLIGVSWGYFSAQRTNLENFSAQISNVLSQSQLAVQFHIGRRLLCHWRRFGEDRPGLRKFHKLANG